MNVRLAPEPPREQIVPISQPEPAAEPAPHEARRPTLHIAPEHLVYDLEDDLPVVSTAQDPMAYLEAQIGLKAPDVDPALRRPPAWRQARNLVPPEEVRDAPQEAPGVPDPAPQTQVKERRSDAPGFEVPVTVAFALFALFVALLIHLVAPSALPGYSVAELDLKVQMRAIEWLLAGMLIALVGLLLKR